MDRGGRQAAGDGVICHLVKALQFSKAGNAKKTIRVKHY